MDYFESVEKLTSDLRKAAVTLSKMEVRFLVDLYYMMQKNRIRCNNQITALDKSNEPHQIINLFFHNMDLLEQQIKGALDAYTKTTHMGQWARSICGIGPVLAAGLEAHIDIEKAPTVGHIWRYAGLDPTVRWEKGQKRPWNASLKVICWKIGCSFVKVSSRDSDVYGKLYRQRKEYELAKNEAGEYHEQAEAILATKNIGKKTDAYACYSIGLLPPAQIDERSKRWAVKLFLSHWHEEAYENHFGKKSPKPYPIAFLNHAHMIEKPQIAA